MSISKAWEWGKDNNNNNNNNIWLVPSEESYYIAQKWSEEGVKKILDFGCGLGRHAIFFAEKGFEVSAFDLSEEATDHLKKWAKNENQNIDVKVADMLNLPYPDNTFDALFAYHVISHTDSKGIKQIINEMTRILKKDGKIFISLCSKETWSYKDAGFPKYDENTVIKTCEGPENGIPHFYVSLDDIIKLFSDFEIEKIRHIDECYYDNNKQTSKHYFISASLRKI